MTFTPKWRRSGFYGEDTRESRNYSRQRNHR
jgi:hypothetical protein